MPEDTAVCSLWSRGDRGMPGAPPASLGVGNSQVVPWLWEGLEMTLGSLLSIGGWGCLILSIFFQSWVLPPPYPTPLREEEDVNLGLDASATSLLPRSVREVGAERGTH